MSNLVQILSGSGFTRIEIQPERKRSSVVYLAISSLLGLFFILLLGFLGSGMYYVLPTFVTVLLVLLCLLAMLLLAYSWLWYLKGREILILGNGKLLHFKDFGLFKIGKEQFPFRRAELLFQKSKDSFNENKDLMDDVLVHKGETKVGIRLESGKIIPLDLSMSVDDARKVARVVS